MAAVHRPRGRCGLERLLNFQQSLLGLNILTVILSAIFWKAAGQNYPTFQTPDSNSIFQNQFLDTSDGSLYIGGLNLIYKFDSTLGLLRTVETGPVDDNPDCRPPPEDCSRARVNTDNHNKVILLHEQRLITCGSIYQGTCRIRDPDTLRVTFNDSIEEVVPNTASGLAVAFVGIGNNDEVLYVASSYGDWLRDVPTVSTRLVSQSTPENELFALTSRNAHITIPPRTITESPAGQMFNISYIYGFTSGLFSYFAGSQPGFHNDISGYTSKLVRLCNSDPNFRSYIELALVCGFGDDNDYNLIQSAYLASLSLDGDESKDILVASFSKSDALTSSVPSTESAICVFDMEDINQEFYDRRLDCAQQGSDNTEIGWFGSTACKENSFLANFIRNSSPAEYCHTTESQFPLGDDRRVFTISASPVYQTDSKITAVAAVQHFETSVIFSGDADGNFKKLRLAGPTAEEYESLSLHGTPIIRNGLLPSKDGEFIFVTSEDQITKVPVEECLEYTTCEECHTSRDPYCGWCSLQAKCTRRNDAQCEGAMNGTSLRWLSATEECLAITMLQPEFVPAESVTELTVDVSSLPDMPYGDSLKCVFMDDATNLGTFTAVVVDEGTVGQGVTQLKCSTPGGVVAGIEGFKTISLELHYEEGGQSHNIASKAIDFYDCTKLSSCSKCAGNKYGCNWCLHSNQCTNNTQCSIGPASAPLNSNSSCPLINKADEQLIPSGQMKVLRFDGRNFPTDTFNFSCRIEFASEGLTLPARLTNDQIECENHSFTYSSPDESMTGSLRVLWGDFPLDMEDEIIVTIYKCSRKAVTMLDGESKPTCGKCLSIDDMFECSWCLQLGECLSPVNSNSCPQTELLTGDMNCPDPTIVSISPQSGHTEGGTRVAILGYNLGLVASDIESITIAGVLCKSTEFDSSQRLYCITSGSLGTRTGIVRVTFNSTSISEVESEQSFSYVQPQIHSLSPVRGPQSGGTKLEVTGMHLDAGFDRSARISDTPCVGGTGYSCEIIENTSTMMICETAGAGNITEGKLSVNFDEGCERSSDTFSYVKDPVVDSFEKLRSIVSGGLKLPIAGDSFDIIQEARLEFRIGNNVFIGNCTPSEKMMLSCKSPDVSAAVVDFPLNLPVMNVSLYMDGVTTYAQLGPTFPASREEFFTFVTDPIYYKLPAGENTIQVRYEEQSRYEIKIEGENLTLASTVSDVIVRIGSIPCVVFDLRINGASCRLGDREIPPRTYNVKVIHGNLEFNVGTVEFLEKGFPWQIAAPIFVTGLVILVIVIFVIIALHYCLNFNDKTFKELENQMIAMETVVAQECKEAFAELQTGVLSITSDVEGTGIPMWDYRSYAMWALFPQQHNHPVLRELTIPPAQRDSVKKGLNRFGLLLANKSFLVQFVEVLEKQNTISVEDFSNIASLLMVCFQGRMDYATEVMKTLLAKAIKEHVREGQQAVLMRRGVHIVEKIVSHWLAFLMYPYLEEVAGDPLFSLFYAIHRQIASGPVDEVTSVARYGLNEGALIRQKVEHKAMNLYVKGIDNNLDEKKVPVLDCDTISQVKEKILEEIYKTSPYSTRPHHGEVDLEWTDSPTGKVLVMDYHGAKTEDGWRLLNTLKTYQVPNNASVSLLYTQNGNTSLSSSSSSPSRSIIYANMSSMSSMTPIITHEKEQNQQFMHLVKQTNTGTSKKFDHKNQKVIAEIYLTRLLTTKGIIQPFVDDLLSTILSIEEGTNLPLPVKYLFDFLDEQAEENNIRDPDILHQWKSNCLQLRFWVNLIKNPNFVFDINKTPAVDNCLSVIGQFLMDSCSISRQTLTKDSPSSRLLYANEIENYRSMVKSYYKNISSMPVISDQEMNTMLADFSSQHQNEFHSLTALNELYFCYATKCRNDLMVALELDESSHKYFLMDKLQEVEKLLAS